MIRLKEHETTAIARPISRMVARRPWLHRILRDFTDPVLLFGTLAAVIRVRWTFVRAVRAGLIAMPADPIAEHAAAQKRAQEVTAPAAAPIRADDAAAPAPPPTGVVLNFPTQHEEVLRQHVPHVEPVLRSAIEQLQDVTA